MWQYQVLQNWGFSPGAFVLNFADTSYPVKTNQGRWINNLINFHIEAITRDEVPAYMYDCDKLLKSQQLFYGLFELQVTQVI